MSLSLLGELLLEARDVVVLELDEPLEILDELLRLAETGAEIFTLTLLGVSLLERHVQLFAQRLYLARTDAVTGAGSNYLQLAFTGVG